MTRCVPHFVLLLIFALWLACEPTNTITPENTAEPTQEHAKDAQRDLGIEPPQPLPETTTDLQMAENQPQEGSQEVTERYAPEPTALPLEERIRRCVSVTNPSKRITCLEPLIKQLSYQDGPTQAMCLLLKLYRDQQIPECHVLAHQVGAGHLKRVNAPSKALAECPNDCQEGCIHGVMEAYLGTLKRGEPVPTSKLRALCDPQAKDSLAWRQCIHGLGHGLLAHGFFTLDKAIEFCESVEDTLFQEACLTGVLMENVDQYTGLDERQLMVVIPRLCSPLKNEKHLRMCAEAVGEGLMFLTGHDLTKSKALCTKLKPPLTDTEVQFCQQTAEIQHKANQERPPTTLRCPK